MIMLISSGWTRFVFFPILESETATATLVMPVGTPFEVTARHSEKVVNAAAELQEKYKDASPNGMITNIFSSIGSSRSGSTATHLATIRFETTPVQNRDIEISTTELINEWRRLVGPIPGAETMNYRASFFRPGEPIDVQFSGNSLESLSAIGEEVKQRLTTYPGVFEIADSLSDGKEELRIELSPQGHLVGLTRSDIVRQVGQAFKGLEAQRIQRGQRRYSGSGALPDRRAGHAGIARRNADHGAQWSADTALERRHSLSGKRPVTNHAHRSIQGFECHGRRRQGQHQYDGAAGRSARVHRFALAEIPGHYL